MPEVPKYLHPPMTQPMVLPQECFGVWDADYRREKDGEVWVYAQWDPESAECRRVAYPAPTDRPLVLRQRGRFSDDMSTWIPEKDVVLGGELDESCYSTAGGVSLRVLSPGRAHAEALRVNNTELWLRRAKQEGDATIIRAAAACLDMMVTTAEDDFVRDRAAGFPPPEPTPSPWGRAA
jgi:hypothetical protein